VAEYGQFLGRKVTVRYRVGEILLSATGTFAADSGRSIFLEQHVEQRGAQKYFRWEIPYPYIYRIEGEELSPETAGTLEIPPGPLSQAAVAGSRDGAEKASSVLPFPTRPKTA
jgi:hypothetical protein